MASNIVMPPLRARASNRVWRVFANHLATMQVEIDLGRGAELDVIARAIQAQADAQRASHRPIKRLLAERQLVALMTLSELQPIIFDTKHPDCNPIATSYGIEAIPTMFLIDKKGVLRSVTARENFEEMIPKLLSE